jgi:hypothetical protein
MNNAQIILMNLIINQRLNNFKLKKIKFLITIIKNIFTLEKVIIIFLKMNNNKINLISFFNFKKKIKTI